MNAPFTYFGGKARIAPEVWARLGNPDVYCEPFLGSAAVLLARPDSHRWSDRIEQVNDADGLLANFWRALKCDPDGVAAAADWPVNECVPAGTMIATPEGEIPVEHVRPGMIVLGESGGMVVPSRVIDTKESLAERLLRIDQLQVTGNHPIWTLERGYIPAASVAHGMTLGRLPDDWVVCQPGLRVLYFKYEQPTVGNLCPARPANELHPLRRGDAPRATAGERAYFTRCQRRQDPFGQPYGRRRWPSWVYTIPRIAREVVEDAPRRAICSGSCFGYEGQTPHPRSTSQDCRRKYRTLNDGCSEAEASRSGEAATSIRRGAASVGAGGLEIGREAAGEASLAGASRKDRCGYHRAKASRLRGDRRSLPVDQGCDAGTERAACVGVSSHQKRVPLQGAALPVFNFQTTTGNYFANRILVHNCDLHARHIWLVNNRESLTERLCGDPDWFDVRAAGWWVWGASAWIAGGWCAGNGPWNAVDGVMTNTGAGVKAQIPHLGPGRGVNRQIPHLGPGRGVNRKIPHMGPGRGVNRKMPHLGDAGMGVDRKMPHLGNAGMDHCEAWSQHLRETMRALANRLRRVRVCCGDWSRIVGSDTTTTKYGTCGVFLDPPYSHEERHPGCYATEMECADAVREWAVSRGADPMMRIALCGYHGEHEMPGGWDCWRWKAAGGYGSQWDGRGRENARRECVWFSPHCVKTRLSLFDT